MSETRGILIVARDSGGAEILSSWFNRNREKVSALLLEGPALRIFERKCGAVKLVSRDTAFRELATFDFVLAGTGWTSDLERLMIRTCRERGVRVAAVLDHWQNFRSRFFFEGSLVLPDEVWVGDSLGEGIARRELPEVVVTRLENPYFEDVRGEFAELECRLPARGPGAPRRVLYVSEPVLDCELEHSGNPRRLGYDEFEALAGYLDHLKKCAVAIERFRLRAHPAEPAGKYDAILARYRGDFAIEVSGGRTLVEDCAWADWVVGCDTMAMVIGLLAGKDVFSAVPKGGTQRLPQPEIKRLFA